MLKLDELTILISKAVIGDARLKDFASPTGSKTLKDFTFLEEALQTDPAKKICNQLLQQKEGEIDDRIKLTLVKVAQHELPELVNTTMDYEHIRNLLQHEQEKAKQKSFSLLEKLRPQRTLEEKAIINHTAEAEDVCKQIREAWKAYEPTKQAAQQIGKERIVISQVLELLVENKLVQIEILEQTCPLCEYKGVKTLSSKRVSEILGWTPVQEAEKTSKKALQQKFDMLLDFAKKIVREWDEFLPQMPADKDWQNALQDASDELKNSSQNLRKVKEEENDKYNLSLTYFRKMIKIPPPLPDSLIKIEEEIARYIKFVKQMNDVIQVIRKYKEAFLQIEGAASATARIDPKYLTREKWLICSGNCASIAADLNWEYAKHSAQKDLETIRDVLINYRKHFLESRRVSFNAGIGSIWGALRADEYSSFSQLHIPEPRGKGFPIEIEVKALLNDGEQQREVDALRVFSESQVNALGISAFITRSKLLGHKVLIFDDPVQSMDEEHFKTFAKDVLMHVLGENFQVILLTHNETFAKDVSYFHQDRPESEYTTMKILLNRRKGCLVEEGNRRVPERLRRAEKDTDDGHYDQAWVSIRRSLERLYVITKMKYSTGTFDPRSWQDQTAEYMWDDGDVGVIIEKTIPGSGKELKDILKKTVAGNHDVSPRGETDLRNTIKYLRDILKKLRLGG